MKNSWKFNKKVLLTISTLLVASFLMLVVLVVVMLPSVINFLGIVDSQWSLERELKYNKKALAYSVFNFQKRDCIDRIIGRYFVLKNYEEVIKYSKELEKIGGTKDNLYNEEISLAYRHLKNYEMALKYAQIANSTSLQIGTYIELKDAKNAKLMLEKFKNEAPDDYAIDLYQAQINYLEQDYKSALNDIDKYLVHCPHRKDAQKLRKEIINHIGVKK